MGPTAAHHVAVRVKLVETAAEWLGVVAVRLAVFVDEQGVPADLELDAHDRHAVHVAAVLRPAKRPAGPQRAAVDGVHEPTGLPKLCGPDWPAWSLGTADLAGLQPARRGSAEGARQLGWAALPANLPAPAGDGGGGETLAPAPIVGTARLYLAAPATGTSAPGVGTAVRDEGQPVARIGRVAVLPAWRRRGVGSRLLVLLEQTARAHGASWVTLHAQVAVEAFYRSHGYGIDPPGEVFLEDGIPHRRMSKPLTGGGPPL